MSYALGNLTTNEGVVLNKSELVLRLREVREMWNAQNVPHSMEEAIDILFASPPKGSAEIWSLIVKKNPLTKETHEETTYTAIMAQILNIYEKMRSDYRKNNPHGFGEPPSLISATVMYLVKRKII